jgi:hypothetical protein
LPFTQTAIAGHPYFACDCLRPASTLNQKSFSRGFAGKNILSVSPRLLKDFKRCGLV